MDPNIFSFSPGTIDLQVSAFASGSQPPFGSPPLELDLSPSSTCSSDPAPSTSSSTSTAAGKGDTPPSDDHAEKQRSCSTCRLRRVRCIRTNPTDLECIGCIKKGIICTPMKLEKRKPQVRTGKRIEEARARFGEHARPPEAQGIVTIRKNQVDDKLGGMELERVLASSLLNVLDEFPQVRVMFFDGAGAPKLKEIGAASRSGLDLVEFGRRREDACRIFTQKVVDVVDQAGLWRKPSEANVSTMLLLEWLIENEEAQALEDDKLTKAYSDCYVSQLRSLLETEGGLTSFTTGNRVAWICYMRDCMSSAHRGRSPRFTVEDVELLAAHRPKPLMSAMEDFMFSNENPFASAASGFVDAKTVLWGNSSDLPVHLVAGKQLVSSFILHITTLSRQCSQRLTGVAAKRKPFVDEEFVRHALGELDAAVAVIPSLVQICSVPLEVDDQRQPTVFLRHLRIGRCSLEFLLHRVIKERLETPDPRAVDDAAYWNRLRELYQLTRTRSLAASLEILGLMDDIEETGAIWGGQLLFSRLPLATSIIIETPATEDVGGDPLLGFTRDVKLKALKAIRRNLSSVSWAFPRLAESVFSSNRAPSVQGAIDQMESLQIQELVGLELLEEDIKPDISFASMNNVVKPSSDPTTTSFSAEDIDRIIREMGESEKVRGDYPPPWEQMEGAKIWETDLYFQA
ncbi:Zn(2)-C7 fungal-type transcription factor [Pseudohyphozyma bogoriensis]|nr:Zn(2)-C7 fungal-type transcription factor [Pseudohyphozyma bogoriensis]